MLTGLTQIIAHVGYPTSTFKAPMIYNPYFDSIGLDACVVPLGVKAENFAVAFPQIFAMSNVHGALITMPHKSPVLDLLDETSVAVKIAGACNAVTRRTDGALIGDMFDGEGFVRGLKRKGQPVIGQSALVIGAGGVGSAIAASLAGAGLARIGLFDVNTVTLDGLARRLALHYTSLRITAGNNDPEGYDIIINATPLGMNAGDPMPVDIARISPASFVGEVVMKQEMTAFLVAARARGCSVQVGIDMLFEMIPAYLEFFGYPATTPERLRELAAISY
ncbi:MAG: shikimate dehydrogenase family protein [Bosea sp. (in: a-proteobacteria)]